MGGPMKLERLQLFGQQFALSWAVTAGDVIYVTGMTGMEIDFDADKHPGFDYPNGHEAQMRQCYRNIGWILGRVGSSLRDIADQTIFFVGDPQAVAAANKVVRTDVFGDANPASAMAGVAALHHPDCLLEMKVIAHRGAGG
jgi:2-iminobutanoate/2-iminopropanoate deaminase